MYNKNYQVTVKDIPMITLTNSIDRNGTSRKGTLKLDYREVIECFGESNGPGTDDDKVEMTWNFKSSHGPISVYAYKQEAEYAEEFSIGALNKESVEEFSAYVEELTGVNAVEIQ